MLIHPILDIFHPFFVLFGPIADPLLPLLLKLSELFELSHCFIWFRLFHYCFDYGIYVFSDYFTGFDFVDSMDLLDCFIFIVLCDGLWLVIRVIIVRHFRDVL
jgi:hypothetical protein